MMCGGTSDVRDADAEIQQLAEGVREPSEEKSGKKYAQYTAVSFKTQVVAGTNYFIKVQVSESEYIHLRVFKPLPHVNGLPSLSSQQEGKTKEDAIEYF